MHSPDQLAQIFRQKQLKLTPQRQLLFGLLYENTAHPSAENLFDVASKRMPGISLRTVYQTLGELAEMGELKLVDIGDGAKRFDPNVDEHQHFVCDSCGAIQDVDISSTPKIRGEGAAFEISEVGVVFHGKCARCVTSHKRSPGHQAKKQVAKTNSVQ